MKKGRPKAARFRCSVPYRLLRFFSSSVAVAPFVELVPLVALAPLVELVPLAVVDWDALPLADWSPVVVVAAWLVDWLPVVVVAEELTDWSPVVVALSIV